MFLEAMEKGNLIMAPFNGVFFAVFGGFLLLLVLSSLLLRKKSEQVRGRVIVCACLLTLVGFVVYKYCLSIDREYDALTANMGGFNWWGELPLQMCNINLILIPVAIWTNNRFLKGYCFFMGPLGALMALIMPGNGFGGYSLLLPRMLGFYGTHFVLFIAGLAMGTFGLYRPRVKDFPKLVLTVTAVTFLVFCLNLLLRYTGLHPKANYFFSVETEGNFLLEIFHSFLPFPFLYLLPSYLILVPYMFLVTGIFALVDRLKGAKAQ